MKSNWQKENDWTVRILWSAVLCVAGLVLVSSVVEVFSFSLSRLTVLAFSVFVSLLIGQYRVKIPQTRFKFPTSSLFAFWGIIWLGVPGGVLLGTTASLAAHGYKPADRKHWLAGISREVIATFFSAVAFYLSLGYMKGSQPAVFAGGFSVPHDIVLASCVMAITHYSQSSALKFLFNRFVEDRPTRPVSVLGLPAVTHAFSLAATVVLFLVFNHFGIEFGLVIVPIAVIGHLAYKIHSRTLEQKTRQITEASRMHLATVEALATAIDARDQVGLGHVRRTQIYAVGIGNILGLNEDDINALRTGALLHDIGKLAVPDHILNKPGPLTAAEKEKIKTHSSVGASILEKVGFPYPVVPTVKYHHEFWNGTGYPEGLRGNSIPLTARILSVADAYDTSRSARPYRPAVSRDEACNFLRVGAGNQFDPKIVDVFLRNLKIFDAEIKAQGLTYDEDAATLKDPITLEADNASPSYVEQIKRANREVFTLYSLARDFSSAVDLHEILPIFTAKIREFVPYDTCLVYLLDDNREFATAVHVDGKNREALKGKRVKVGEGATGYVLKKVKAVENIDPALDFAFSHLELSREYLAMASIPLLAGEKLIGAVALYSSKLPQYQDEHLRLLETVSRIATDAISKSLQHAEAENHALTDPMTGLPNARSLHQQFEKEVKRATRNGNVFQLLVLDLDGFKAVNDTYGHKTGDKMLKDVGNIIRGQLRDYDFLSRYGGDEFVAIVPDTHSADVLELCQRIETAVSEFELPVGDGNVARVGVSIGAACYPHHGETFDQIVISADKAMYLTKTFHKKRNVRLDEILNPPPIGDVEYKVPGQRVLDIDPDGLTNFAVIETSADEGLIVELDETHIVSSAAVN